MLLQFKVKNYKSFAEEAVLDMTATSIREHTSSLLDVNGNKVLPVAALYGANASGKSNFLKAFDIMKCEVMGRENKETQHAQISGYYYDQELRKEPTEFEVCIVVEGVEYRYGFARDKEKIYEEWLFERKFAKGTRAKEKCVYYRTNNKIVSEVRAQKEKKEIEFVNSMLGEGELIITALGKRKKSRYKQVYMWFVQVTFSVFLGDDKEEKVLKEVVAEILFKYEGTLEKIKDGIQLVDPDIIDIKIKKEQNAYMEETYNIYSYHTSESGELIETAFSNESDGTKKLFFLLYLLVITVDLGKTLFVDELDAKLHPLILRYIVRMFTTPEKNTGKGQLIFSSHNLICLDSADLRRDEIWFVEKNRQKSTLFSLYDFKDEDSSVRADMNFGKNYLSGRFGAIPFQERED